MILIYFFLTNLNLLSILLSGNLDSIEWSKVFSFIIHPTSFFQIKNLNYKIRNNYEKFGRKYLKQNSIFGDRKWEFFSKIDLCKFQHVIWSSVRALFTVTKKRKAIFLLQQKKCRIPPKKYALISHFHDISIIFNLRVEIHKSLENLQCNF